jgi:hypothetical protein
MTKLQQQLANCVLILDLRYKPSKLLRIQAFKGSGVRPARFDYKKGNR